MKVLLMHPDRDFDVQQELQHHASDLALDLELETLLRAMAGDDELMYDAARTALLAADAEARTIAHRQAVLNDCLDNPAAVRELYALAVETTEQRRRHYFGIGARTPGSVLYGAVEILPMLAGMLGKLRTIANAQAGRFKSQGFTAFFAMLRGELGADYLATIRRYLSELKFKRGVLASAELGNANEGRGYVVRRPRGNGQNWLARWLGQRDRGYTVRVDDRDVVGAEILSDMRNRSLNVVANAVAQATDHILSFFHFLRTELAFYVGCLNLHDRLAALELPAAFPHPEPAGTRRQSFRGLRDICLALTMGQKIVGNALDADGKNLAIITGANQGGKSSFLRAVGTAQLMMQCGMFVAAESYAAELCNGLFSHYRREEDTTMKSGKLDEELSRMSRIADAVVPDSWLLFNESFASTDEREGSEIARQIVCALLEKHVRVFFVTHLYEFAHGMFDRNMDDAIFLLAERRADGTRTFRIVEGEPRETSYGEDLYRRIFTAEAESDDLGAEQMPS